MRMMKPILFNTEMTAAILAGRKTVTRRVIKPRPELKGRLWTFGGAGWSDGVKVIQPMIGHSLYNKMPYKPGDVLWVRETWCERPVTSGGHFRINGTYYYKSDGDLRPDAWRGNWRPSIHMPCEAARLFLRVKDVRVERLQDITAEQAQAEGVLPNLWDIANESYGYVKSKHVRAFNALWNSTIKPANLLSYGWDANPWAWVIEFEKIGKEDAERGI